jgi:hypothetical protein
MYIKRRLVELSPSEDHSVSDKWPASCREFAIAPQILPRNQSARANLSNSVHDNVPLTHSLSQPASQCQLPQRGHAARCFVLPQRQTPGSVSRYLPSRHSDRFSTSVLGLALLRAQLASHLLFCGQVFGWPTLRRGSDSCVMLQATGGDVRFRETIGERSITAAASSRKYTRCFVAVQS